MDLDKIKNKFSEYGMYIEIIPFQDVDFSQDWSEYYVLYQSSEDRGLLYKGYISDVLTMLEKLGATLIPNFEAFYCHENKVYQSLLGNNIELEGVKIPKSSVYGTLECLENDIENIHFPIVLKSAEGCQSKGVALIKSQKELRSTAKKLMSTFNFKDVLRYKLKSFFKDGYIMESSHRSKVILQEFVPDLPGDYKVLVYKNKTYALKRLNRKNDFRASGSGRFEFSTDVPDEVLQAANNLVEHFKCPYISVDLAFDPRGKEVHLIEFQFLMFGTYTLEKSPHYFVKEDANWKVIEQNSVLEHELVDSIVDYISKYHGEVGKYHGED
ncbi:hypothetical protein PAUR_a3075 [Pseudoalteromonas aurantia 208]|uniref:ATP-grasp domain-containing protein n=2 Tax=Pseudoalteromonas aurantia TaxID=43654 RepID=A0ABR9EGA4_9GAMM|nr:hypothetical protein [Pseudoalteromonas aurantia 208]